MIGNDRGEKFEPPHIGGWAPKSPGKQGFRVRLAPVESAKNRAKTARKCAKTGPIREGAALAPAGGEGARRSNGRHGRRTHRSRGRGFRLPAARRGVTNDR